MANYTMPGAYIYNDGTHGWSAIGAWAALTAYSAGNWVRQLAAPTGGNERAFVCIIAGTSLASEPTWVITIGAKTAEAAGPTWMECTGRSGPNGDITNTNSWGTSKVATQGYVIKDVAATTLFICTTAGTSTGGAEPTWNKTAGQTTTDGTAVWTSIGAISGFTGGQYPQARLENALASGWSVAGDNLYLANTHAQTAAAAVTITNGQGTALSPCKMISVPWNVFPPTSAATGASIATTGANSITLNNTYNYFYGLTFLAGSGASLAHILQNNAIAVTVTFDTCIFTLNNTNASSTVQFGNNAFTYTTVDQLYFINCKFRFGATGQGLGNSATSQSGTFIGGSVADTGSVPTTLFPANGRFTTFFLRDMDLSAITGTIFNSTAASSIIGENCKLGAGVTISPTTPADPYFSTEFNNCDSGATNYRQYRQTYSGTLQQEITIVRTAGATNGTTPISWNVGTNANTTAVYPFVSDEIAQWNNITGSAFTAGIYLTSNTVLDNSMVWIEVEYLGASTSPLGSRVVSQAALLTSPTTLPTDISTWGGGALAHKYVITSPSFTPQLKGPVKVRIYVATPSITIYFDPQISNLATPTRDYIIPGWGYINETSSGGSYVFCG